MPRAASKNGIYISLIIPAYNEEKVIEKTAQSYADYFSASPLISKFEIILVSNNCKDSTPTLCAALAKKNKLFVHADFPYYIGKGGAVLEGFRLAKYDNLGFTDADNATQPEEFLKLIPGLSDPKVGAVIASRHMRESKLLPPQPFYRRIIGMGFAVLRELLFGLGILDSQCGAKVFKREAISPLELKTRGYTWDVEWLYKVKKRGFTIKEIGITWRDFRDSKVGPLEPFRMFWELIKMRLTI